MHSKKLLMMMSAMRFITIEAKLGSGAPLGIYSDSNYILKKLIVIHRHGDRSQIAKSAGPFYPESDHVTNIWKEKLPTQETIDLLIKSAPVKFIEHDKAILDTASDIYIGRDKHLRPYGMLTEIGTQQLIQVGKTLRTRYAEFLQSSGILYNGKKVYCRSTGFCRTITSLRGLLIGLLNITSSHDMIKTPIIETRHQHLETLYPDEHIPCPTMIVRRKELYKNDYISSNFENYFDLETKFKTILGFQDKVKWFAAREVLVCQSIHQIKYTEGFTQDEIDRYLIVLSLESS
jgi:hypothetical protein